MSSNADLKEIIATQEQEIVELRAEISQLKTANAQGEEEIKSLKQTLRDSKVHRSGTRRKG